MRDSLNDKKLGDDLILDIARYSRHPDIDILICFLYDPEYHIKNPKGLALDLEKKSTDNLKVRVFVVPE